jgi:diphosphomevalonate decarboxylase
VKSTSEQEYLDSAFSGRPDILAEGTAGWQSPSNIAIVKYWGKYGNQLPMNPSLSLTLSAARTETTLTFRPKESKGISLQFSFEGKPNPPFADKIHKFLTTIEPFFPFLTSFELNISSHNTFPHSSGIASSASSMSALVLCLLDMEQQLSGQVLYESDFLRKASYFSRLASGSASRSVFPYASVWGKSEAVTGSSQEFAVPAERILHHEVRDMRDSILIVHSGTKSVSSRAGHALMENNPFSETRYALAHQNLGHLTKALSEGDLDAFVRITEEEAMQLHALMMTSRPSYLLIEPQTVAVIQAVRRFRKEQHIPICFTLDAGPNVHLLYPGRYADEVHTFIREELLQFCTDGRWIDDRAGSGPGRIAP